MRHHGVLANELFSESQARRSWTEARYQCYLAAKHVDRVVMEAGYTRQSHTNEDAIIGDLVAKGLAQRTYGGTGGRLAVYDVTAFRDGAPAPSSVKDCAER
jgi:hypothetical protein